MRSTACCCGAAIVLIALCCPAWASGVGAQLPDELPPFDVDQWLRGPDRKDIPWSVRVFQGMTLQQRHFVRVNAEIGGGRLPRSESQRDLHFVLKVAAADNRWVPGYSYTRVRVPPRLEKFEIVTLNTRVYLRPGSYTLALIVYDPVLGKGNIRRKRVKISRMKGDPLPQLDRDLRHVDFVSANRPLAEGKEWLPVKNNRCLCIDIVANTPVDYDHNPKLDIYYSNNARFRGNVTSLDILQASSVLSHLALRNGYIRVSIVDPLRRRTYFRREDATDFNWQRAARLIEKKPDPVTIDKDLLGMQSQASAYLLDLLNEILEDKSCAPQAESPLKIVIVVSRQMKFPKGTIVRQVIPRNSDSVRFFYLRITDQYGDDDLLEMLRKTGLKKISGLRFRNDLADLISYLEKIK